MTKKVKTPGHGQINLTQRDFIASGGEGEIYGKGDTVYKIYHDPKKMIPYGKFDDLSELTERHIVNPQEIILDGKNNPIGFTMEWFKNNLPICKVFTTGFRNKAGFTPEDAIKLVEKMQELIDFIHSKECLIVDFNDINFLIDAANMTQPIFIDVDSYKTKNYPPTAITPFVQDHHSKSFSPLTDWFSFAVIAFQIFIGMHPFKGSCDGFTKGDVIARMKTNTSVFNRKVKTPPAARDISHIPTDFRNWMEDAFERGKRVLPPMVGGRIQVATPVFTKITGSNNFDITLVKGYASDILYHFSFMNEDFVRVGNTLYVGKSRQYNLKYNDSQVIVYPETMVPFEITEKSFRPLDSRNEEPISLSISKMMVSNNIPVIKMHDSISPLMLNKFSKYMLAINKTWQVLPFATKLFSGLVYQDIMGIPYLWIPEAKNGSLVGEFFKVPELSGYVIVSAKCIKNVAVIIGAKAGEYAKFILRYNKGTYDIKIKENIDYQTDPNFTVLDKGVVVLMNEDSEIEIFRSDVGENQVKVIEDKQIDNTCILSSNGSQVLFYRGKELYKLRMVK